MQKPMTFDRASELLGLTTPKPLARQKELAESMLRNMSANAPLRFKVAARTIIRFCDQNS